MSAGDWSVWVVPRGRLGIGFGSVGFVLVWRGLGAWVPVPRRFGIGPGTNPTKRQAGKRLDGKAPTSILICNAT